VIVVPPHENLGPPLEAEGAPAENGTPTDHSNVNSNFIKQYRNATLGRWSPLTWALSYAAAGYLVIPLEHGRNIPHRLLLGKGWSAKAGTAGSRDPDQIKAWWQFDCSAMIGIVTAVSAWSPLLIIASCIRSAERYFGPKAEIPQPWIEPLRRVL
jgi:hypothetical protein